MRCFYFDCKYISDDIQGSYLRGMVEMARHRPLSRQWDMAIKGSSGAAELLARIVIRLYEQQRGVFSGVSSSENCFRRTAADSTLRE